MFKSFKFLLALVLLSVIMPLSGCKAEPEQSSKDFLESPLSFMVVDLDGDGVELIPLEESNVYFDVDGDGYAEKTQWVHPDDGFLLIRSTYERRSISSPFEMILNRQTNLRAKLINFDKNDDQTYDTLDFANTGERRVQELIVTLFQDNDTLGIQKNASSSDYTPCKGVKINFKSPEVLKLNCGGHEYNVQENKFRFEDTNIKWDVVCQGAQAGASYDDASKKDYLKYCIKK
ncbi:MAG: hypothetical protein VX196_00090 [Pseudomonadota bacterium]|jgi:hypothetical protein|nr:hypothetical protein [Pseudomonadota bacterium]